MHSVVWIVNPCDCFVWGKRYTFLESLLIGKQNKQCPIFYQTVVHFTDQNKKVPKITKSLKLQMPLQWNFKQL